MLKAYSPMKPQPKTQFMSADKIRNALGIYFLIATAFFGAYILLLAQTAALPISKADSDAGFQILVPSFVAQIAMIFRFLTMEEESSPARKMNLPAWAVLGPPIATSLIFLATILSLVLRASAYPTNTYVDGSSFRCAISFIAVILNASSTIIVLKLFGANRPSATEQQPL